MLQIEDNIIRLIRGDSAEFDIEILDLDGEPYELQDGDVVEFSVKENIYAKSPLIYKTGTEISISPADTARLPYQRYVYDVQLTFADGSVDTIIPPTKFEILGEVTF